MRLRFSAVMVGLTLFVLALFSGSFYYLEHRAALAAQEQAGRDSLAKVLAVCREAILEHSPIPAINYIRLVRREEGVVSAYCLDAAPRFLAHSDPRFVGRTVTEAADLAGLAAAGPTRMSGPGAIVDRRAPILVSGRTTGAVRLAYDARVLERQIHERLIKVLARILLVSSSTFALALLLALYLASTLLRPIDRLVAATREIGAGHLDHKVDLAQRTDELGFLAREFNAMATRLKELDELKEKFLHSITHDLRSPLTAILGYVELMLEGLGGPITETQAKYLRIVSSNSNKLAGYIGDILDVAKIQAGQMEFEKKPVSIVETVSGVAELLAATAHQMGIALRLQAAPGVPPVLGDADKLSRVVTNLVSNAMKFTPRGGSIFLTISRADAAFVLVSVRDTGVGIPENQLDKVFEKFYQVTETKAQARKVGTGLGLTITKEMVEGHGGRIWVESRAGSGADFKFTLPVAA